MSSSVNRNKTTKQGGREGEKEVERGKGAAKEEGRKRENSLVYKIQTSCGFPGHSQQLFIILGRIDPTCYFKIILSNVVALLEGIKIIIQHCQNPLCLQHVL